MPTTILVNAVTGRISAAASFSVRNSVSGKTSCITTRRRVLSQGVADLPGVSIRPGLRSLWTRGWSGLEGLFDCGRNCGTRAIAEKALAASVPIRSTSSSVFHLPDGEAGLEIRFAGGLHHILSHNCCLWTADFP